MSNTSDRIQVILIVAFIIDVLMLILSVVLTRSLGIANYVGYAGMLIIGSLFLYRGYEQLSSLRKKEGEEKAVWYKQPWILCGWTTHVLLILFFISNVGKK